MGGMSADTSQLRGDHVLSDRARAGDPVALAELREQCHSNLVNILLARGAGHTEAQDLLADLWTDCVPGGDDRPGLLDKFSGKCSVAGWLATVATRRWIDIKRRESKRRELAPAEPSDSSGDPFERLPAEVGPDREDSLVELLRASLKAAFAGCPAVALVLLRLVYLHGITQRELVRMLDWHESKVSRTLTQAMEDIERRTLAEIRRRDPWLELAWQDF